MKVLLKMTIGLTAAGIAIFGVYGLHLLRAERRELAAAVEREMRLLGRSLRSTAEYALRDRQIEDIREVLRALEIVDEAVEVAVYTPEGEAILTTEGSPLAPQFMAEAAGAAMESRIVHLSMEPPDQPSSMLLATPLLGQGDTLMGALVLLRPLDDLHADLVATRRRAVSTVVAFVLVSAGLGLLLGSAYIARPLARTVAAMRRVRAGDLTSAVPVGSRDEIGQLAAEFNAMVAELGQARVRLEEEIEARRRLQRSLQQADKLITIGQLSAGLAHEIGSPLQVLNGRARWLAGHAADAETRRVAGILVTQSDRIARIVEQLMRFARRREAHPTEIDVEANVRAVVDLLEHEARRRGIELIVRSGDPLPRLVADADQLQQVVLNLITNALNATARDGRVELALKHIVLDPPAGDVLRLTVSDSGRGISPADCDRLFEPFFTTRGAEGGTGLGLAVVKAIVTEHGGTIAVESNPGGGARFTVDLPAAERGAVVALRGVI